jgi:Dolichyl-phosphate-mannose-protein mannosyltransferase
MPRPVGTELDARADAAPQAEQQESEPSRRRLPSVPTWAALAGVFVLSFAVRFYWAVRDPAPWIFSDELHYWEPAKALAYTGSFAIREVPGTGGFGFLYPTLIAPAFLLFERLPDVYDAVKAINSLLMSLTVVPVFFLARRVAGRGLAIAAAAFSVALPALTYTSNLMVENVFYPLTAFWILAFVRALERPTVLRQALVIVLIGVAAVTKAQAVTFVPVLVTAILVVVLLDGLERGRAGALGRMARGLARFWPTWALLALAVPVVLIRQAIRDQPLRELLGAYNAVLDREYPIDQLAQWALWHVAALDIVLGVFPFAAFLLMAIYGLRPAAPRELRIFAAVGLATTLWFLIVVSAFALTPTVTRILERNLFHVMPLFFIALVAWIARGAPRPWWALAPAALFAGTLTLALPINNFLTGTLVHSTPGLLPLWRWRDRLFSPESIDEVVAVAAIVGAVLFVLVPRRWLATVTIVLLAGWFAAASRPVESFTHQASIDAYNTIRSPRDWVDDAAGIKADVASFYWSGDQFRFWESEFFNRSVGPVYSVPGPYDGLPGLTHVAVDPSGLVRGAERRPVRAEYVLADVDTEVAGTLAARKDDAGMVLYRTPGDLVVRQRVDGLYPDRWSGAQVGYRRFDCDGGTVTAFLSVPQDVERDPAQVTAVVEGGRQYTATVGQTRTAVLRVPLTPSDGVCAVIYTVPTVIPADISESLDARPLGVRFRFSYEPPQ